MASFNYQTSHVYFRDQFVSFSEANVSIVSSPMLYGLAIYTVFAVNINPETEELVLFRLQDHFERLVASAKILDMQEFLETWDYNRFKTVMQELLEKNNIKQHALVRVTVFIDELLAGAKMHGLKNSVSAIVYEPPVGMEPKGINVKVSSWQRTADNAIPSRAKITGSYANAALMKNDALLDGYDDAIALDEHGHISESTVSNLFLVRKGTLLTPHTGTDLLEGITRDSVLKIAAHLGIPTEERSIDRSELYLADEVFVCGSSMWITPVLSVDRKRIADGQAGEITRQLSRAYAEAQTGQLEAYKDWTIT